MKYNYRKNRQVKTKKWVLTIIVTSTLIFSTAHAQKNFNTTGGTTSEPGGSVSYSVGQLTFQVHTGTNGSITEGVQQPYEISIVTTIKEANGINLSVSAYPNPATNYLMLKVDTSTTLNIREIQYKLYDMNGKLLQNKNLTGSKTEIDMSNYVSATYFVKVISKTQSIKEFKIIKL